MTVREIAPGQWLFEEICPQGGVLQALFTGPHAKDRAYEYLLMQSAPKGSA